MPRKKGTPKTGGRKKGSKNRATRRAELASRVADLMFNGGFSKNLAEFMASTWEGQRISIEAERIARKRLVDMEIEVEHLRLEEAVAVAALDTAMQECGVKPRHLELVH